MSLISLQSRTYTKTAIALPIMTNPDENSGAIRWSDWEEPDETDVEVCKFFLLAKPQTMTGKLILRSI